MASLQFDVQAETYRIRFRYAGKGYFRSLKTASEKEAESRCGAVEKIIRALDDGYLAIPPGVDPGDFILTDGRVSAPAVIDLSQPAPEAPTLRALLGTYEAELTVGTKEANSLGTEEIHRRHLLAHFGDERTDAIDHKAIQDYVNARSRAGVVAITVKKELTTLRMIWNWGTHNNHIASALPWRMGKLTFPKEAPKEPFQTWEQIERKIAAGQKTKGWDAAREERLWECLYLDEQRIARCLAHVRKHARYPFVHPMFCFCAYTGARRGEILRSEREDWDLAAGTVAIREKKRDTSKTFTVRHVPIHPELKTVMREWFRRHPGGPWTICTDNTLPIGVRMATKYFRSAVAGGDWKVLHGFHVFRHSVISLMASKGVDQRIIDSITGHSTEEMRRRYSHLFPARQQSAIVTAFG
jgi:integrase